VHLISLQAQGKHWDPQWFTRKTDASTGEECWQYTGEYWRARERAEWSKCARIYEQPALLAVAGTD
jgi:hypothetical protein